MYNVVTGYEIGFIHDYPTIYIYIYAFERFLFSHK